MVKEFQQKQLLIVEKLTRLALNTLVYFIMAKFLDEKDFGIYNHIISIVLLINALSTLGFESYLVKVFIEKSEEKYLVLSTCIISRLTFSFMLLLISYVVVSFKYEQEGLTLFIVLFLCFSSYDVFDYLLQSERKVHISSMIKITVLIIFNVSKIYIIYTGGGLDWLLIFYFLEFPCLFLLFVCFSQTKINLRNYSFPLFKKLLNKTWPLIPAGVSLVLYSKIDQVMIGYLLPPEELSSYSVAVKIIESTFFLAQITLTIAMPKLVSSRLSSMKDYAKLTKKVVKELAIYSVISMISILIISKYIVMNVFYGKFDNLFEIVLFYCPAIVLVYFRVYLTRFLQIEDLVKFSLILHIVTALSNVILNLVLIKYMGVLGAALATSISYIISFVVITTFCLPVKEKIKNIINENSYC